MQISGPQFLYAMHPHIIRLCLPDLNVGVKHLSRYLSPGLLHTQFTLEDFPILSDASSVQITHFQSASPHVWCSLAQASLAHLWVSLRKDFAAEICVCMSKSCPRTHQMVLMLTLG